MQPEIHKKAFLNSINYFRGIAIFLIVLGHCFALSRWEISSPAAQFFHAITLNGSVYFVFISGFLYHHVFYHRFDWLKFITKKIKYVLLPYLFFSTLPIIYEIYFNGGGEYLPEALKDKHLLGAVWYFLTGRISYAYWYIPMAMLLFAISPLINWIIIKKQVLFASLSLLAISVLIHRPIDNINPVHSLIYYLPVYLIGIYSSLNQSKIYAYLKNNYKKAALVSIALGLGIIQIFFFQELGNFHKEFWSVTVPDVNLIQKILFCFLFISILDRYENNNISIAKKTAETSFAIYFIHPFLINILISLSHRLNINYEGNILILILCALTVTLISMAIAYCFKATFKKNSRYLIGW